MAAIKSVKSTLPPGPRGLPMLGSLLSVQGEPHIKVNNIVRKYGDVCTIRLGSTPTVVISHPGIVREAFSMRELADRWLHPALEDLIGDFPDLVFGHYDEQWRDLQRYANRNVLSHRRVDAVRETYVEPMMDLFVEAVDDTIDSSTGKGELRPRQLFPRMNARTMVDIIFGIYGMADSEGMDDALDSMLSTVSWAFTVGSVASPIRYLPAWIERTLLSVLLKRARGRMSGMSRFNLADYRDDPLFDLDNPTCLLEVLLADERRGEIEMPFVEALVVDLLVAGTDTNGQTMSWFVMNLANNPEVQDRIYDELENCDTEGRKELGVEDMPNLPYTHAALMESMRYSTVAPFALPHRASRDCEVGGYNIPEGAQVLPNIWGIHHDERFWESPFEFKPERFMPQEDGSPSPNMRNEAYMPFSVGRRACPGQGLAMTMLWLQTVRLLHHFRFEAPPGGISESAQLGLSLMPRSFWVRVVRR